MTEEAADAVYAEMQKTDVFDDVDVYKRQHLSSENNLPELAMQSVREAFLQAGIVPQQDCVVRAASRYEISPVCAV